VVFNVGHESSSFSGFRPGTVLLGEVHEKWLNLEMRTYIHCLLQLYTLFITVN
jgi:hypothetical protein